MKNYGLIIRPYKKHQWIMGSGKATNKLGADASEINKKGDWSKGDSDKELQRKNGFETQNCTNHGTHLALIALAKHKGYKHFPQNCSERYPGIGTGTSIEGNDAWHVIETVATKLGVIHEEILPFSENIHGWDEYYSPSKNSTDYQNLVQVGQEIIRETEIEPEWVLPPGNLYTQKEKRERIKAALKRGPVCVSVQAWSKKNGLYTKGIGLRDNHWVWLMKYEGDNPIIRDHYEPFIKKLDKDYDFNIAIVYFMRPNPTKVLPKDKPLYLKLLKSLLSLLQELKIRLGWGG